MFAFIETQYPKITYISNQENYQATSHEVYIYRKQ